MLLNFTLLAMLLSSSAVSAALPPGFPLGTVLPLTPAQLSTVVSYSTYPDSAFFDAWPAVSCHHNYLHLPGDVSKTALSRVMKTSIKRAADGMSETGYGIIDKPGWSILVHYHRYRTASLHKWHFVQLGVYSLVTLLVNDVQRHMLRQIGTT